MKRIIVIMMCLCIVLSLVACGGDSSSRKNSPEDAVACILKGLKGQEYDTYLLAFDPNDTLRTDNRCNEREFNNEAQDFIEYFGSATWSYEIQSVDTYPLGQWAENDKFDSHHYLPECLEDVAEEYAENKHGVSSNIGRDFAICPVEIYYEEASVTLYFYLYQFDGVWYVSDYSFSYIDN